MHVIFLFLKFHLRKKMLDKMYRNRNFVDEILCIFLPCKWCGNPTCLNQFFHVNFSAMWNMIYIYEMKHFLLHELIFLVNVYYVMLFDYKMASRQPWPTMLYITTAVFQWPFCFHSSLATDEWMLRDSRFILSSLV